MATTPNYNFPLIAGTETADLVVPSHAHTATTASTGVHDAYSTGDKVHQPNADSAIYVSKIDGNVWPPAEGGNDFQALKEAE